MPNNKKARKNRKEEEARELAAAAAAQEGAGGDDVPTDSDGIQSSNAQVSSPDQRAAEAARRAFLQTLQTVEAEQAEEEEEYVNEEVPLPDQYKVWQQVAPSRYVRYEQFQGTDEEMEYLIGFFTEMLSEPYSSFTYQYFVFGWPDLCITVYGVVSDTEPGADVVGEKVGAIVSRVSRKAPLMPLRGYIAMFAVAEKFRGFRLGRRLVAISVELMKEKRCDEVYLETPITSTRALDLYSSLGFAKTKYLPRYYLDHSDAVRMKLWLTDAIPKEAAVFAL